MYTEHNIEYSTIEVLASHVYSYADLYADKYTVYCVRVQWSNVQSTVGWSQLTTCTGPQLGQTATLVVALDLVDGIWKPDKSFWRLYFNFKILFYLIVYLT